MRLDRLDLVRYGKFTDRSLDFGVPQPGKPDFHLVHGPNEAGKSTLFSAYLDLLFGIEKSSAYGFLHPYPLMRVGGLLSIGQERHEAFRLKRNQGSLVAADDRTLPDTLFASVLGGMDRNAYRTMFSLDDESIERGGEDILKSEGELGAMLFSASSGLSDMASGLAALKAEADEFYRASGRKHGLSLLKAEIDALAGERKAMDVAARDYGLLVGERDAAAERHRDAVAARTEARAALSQVERSLSALPYLARLRVLRVELAVFDLGESPPAAWRPLLGELAREEAEIAARAARVTSERARYEEEREALVEDDAVLAAEADIAALSGSALEARFRTAAMDLAAREADRERLAASIGSGLALLGLPPDADPAQIVLPDGRVEKLTALLSRRAALAERSDAARRELVEAEKALSALEGTGGAVSEMVAAEDEDLQAKLSAMLRAARASDLPARLREARRLVALAAQDADEALARLAPWTGATEALQAMKIPTAQELDGLRKRYDAASEARLRQQEQIAALGIDMRSAEAALKALRSETGLVTGEHAAELRALREGAWQVHLGQLTRETADAFEQTMRRDDAATDARLRNADRLSEMRVLERSIGEAAARREALAGAVDRLEQAKAELDADIACIASGFGLQDSVSLSDLVGWLDKRAAALEKLTALAKAKTEAGLIETEASERLARLSPLLGDAMVASASLDEALFLVEDRLEALNKAHAQRTAMAEQTKRAKADLEARRQAAEEAVAVLAEWQAAWDGAIDGTWLASERAPAGMERISALLPVLQTLAQNAERRRELDHRIAAMRRDQQDYTAHARRLAERLSAPFDEDDPLNTVAALNGRIASAKTIRDRRQTIDTALARLEEEAAALAERQATLSLRQTEILSFLGVDTLADAANALEAYRKRDDLAERIADAARDLMQQMRTETVDEAEALLVAIDDDQLVAEKSDLMARLDALDRSVQEQHLAWAKAEEALARIAGSDEAAALEERRRTAMIELAEKSRRYLATRAGIMAAEQALRLYRERHRSAMMDRASRTFRDITGGEYAGLSTVMEKDGEFLVVNAASGASKLAKDLSKGTRFQLYLALRVAGYHEIAASREVVPFIADDIMETFDDRRALNALRVMGEMAKSGQVIYLTHHQHLRDLAMEACPDVKLHEL